MFTQRISIAVAVLTIVTCGVWVSAQSTAPDRGIPFRGVVELNGTPIDGDVTLSLRLSSDRAATDVLWSNERTVSVNAGAFAVVLGEQSALPQSVFDVDALFVSVGVVTAPGTVVDIGTQQVFAAFQAVSAADATNAFNADYANRAQDFLIERNGATSRIRFQAETNDPGEIVHEENSNSGNLWLSSSDDWDTGADNDRIIFGEQASNTRVHTFVANGNASHSGDLFVGGNLDVAGNIIGLSYTGESTAERRNTGGNGDANLGSASRRFCFLTRVEFEDLDSAGEFGRCQLLVSGGNWILRASLGGTIDADAVCGARCFSFD